MKRRKKQKREKWYYVKPTAAQLELKPGDVVQHWGLGRGQIINEWGSWKACRSCYAPVGGCKHEEGELTVSGEGVFEVVFLAGKVLPVNRVWLEPVTS